MAWMSYGSYEEANIGVLVGMTLVSAEATDDSITFVASNGDTYVMHHQQECCEDVSIESIVGDISDLVGAPITMAEAVSSDDAPPKDPYDAEYGSYTWTFYKFATVKGYVDVRWYGVSNGYYSETVDFVKLLKN